MGHILYKRICNVIILIFMLKCVNCQQEVGSYCTDNSQASGVCKLITDCPAAIAALNNQVFPKNCGFQGALPIVCCVGGGVNIPLTPSQTTPKRPPTSTPPTTRKPTSASTSRPTPTSTQSAILKVGDKSKAKCKEYAKHVYIYPIVGSQGVDDCVITGVPEIVGGVPALAKEFPHMALLGYENENKEIKWQCGGSLISDEFILTAAHCLFHPQFEDVKYVRLGELQIDSDQDEAQTQDFTVKERFRHPDYKGRSKYNDIALLKLNRKARLNNYVRPACLETRPTVNFSYRPTATGWGKTAYTGETSTALLKVALEYFTHAECDEVYKSSRGIRLNNGIVDSSQVCAGSHKETKDTCSGDSGGPLQIVNKEPYCTYTIVGVTSFGRTCGIVNIPGVYTRVSNYIAWIEGIVWP